MVSHPNNEPSNENRLGSGAIVGRQREMAELRRALDDALAGRGRLVMLAGEPGIGKTRLAQELAAQAGTLGAQVLWGRCYEEAGAPPYWPWVQPIRSYIQTRNSEQLRSELGQGASNIAEVVPELREQLPDLGPPPQLDSPEQARFRLFESIRGFLERASQNQPLILVLDDLHWADRPSLLLLEFIAGELMEVPALILGTYRDVEVSRRHPLYQSLGNLLRTPRFTRVELEGLDRDEVAQLLRITSGTNPSNRMVEVLHGRTEGNPLFLNEILRMLGQEAIVGNHVAASSIPEGVKEAIGRRLDRVSEGCNQVLNLASVIGREFDYRLLRALNDGGTEERLQGFIDEALNSHLIEEVPGSVNRYQFTHALVQETLAEELSTYRRVQLHARIAEALEGLYPDNAEAHAAELAHHFAEAEPVLGADKLVHYSLLAGEQALGAYAWEQALDYFQRGLAAKGNATDAETAALLFGLARSRVALSQRSHVEEVVASLIQAFDYYAAAGDVDRSMAIAEFPLPRWTGSLKGMAQLVSRTLDMVPPDSHEAGRLLSLYGHFMGTDEGDYDAAQDAFGRAMAIAHRQGDVALEMRTLAGASRVDVHHNRLEESLEKSLKVIELAPRANDAYNELDSRRTVITTATALGSFDGMEQQASAMLRLAERLRDRYWLNVAIAENILVSYLMGDWKATRDFTDRTLEEVGPRTGVLACRALLEYQVGDFIQGEAYLEQLISLMNLSSPEPSLAYAYPALMIPLFARITGVTSRFDVAEKAAQIVLMSPGVTPARTKLANAGLSLMAVQRGDIAAAQEHYHAFASEQGTMLDRGTITTDRLLGLLAHTVEWFEQATSHFDDAVTFCRKAGYRPELAWTCCDYAETLLQRNEPRDRERAISLLDESSSISTELGMRPLMERVAALLERAESQQAKAPAYPDGLTQREVEVLRLIASGKTDREIANELVISSRTVNNHVRSILNKTAVANRTEAATYAAREGLTSLRS